MTCLATPDEGGDTSPWPFRDYHWCECCGEKACNDGDRFCPTCIAAIDLMFEELMSYG